MTTIVLEHVVKRFEQTTVGQAGHLTAVNDVSLKVHTGEVLAVLGPSGCGKTTLLRLIAGLEIPDEGSVLFDDVDLQQIPNKERRIGMVFQNYALMPHWENKRTVGFFLSLRKREEEIPERVARISKITGIGLDTLLERRPHQLSGGEQQRVAVARALTRDPGVFLFDEPFANLDAKLRAQARVELKRLLNEFVVTSVYVTHDQVEAIALATRIAVMREGHLEQVGTYSQLYSNPVNMFVATFIGMPIMNMFPGHALGGQWIGDNFGEIPIRNDLEDGYPVTAGVRPEAIHLTSEGIRCVVDRVTPFHSERYQLIEVHIGGESWTLTAPLTEYVEVGRTVSCSFRPEAALFFDSGTGKRIG